MAAIWILTTYSRFFSEKPSLERYRWAMPMTALSGVRISWLMLARNSLFILLASSERTTMVRREETRVWRDLCKTPSSSVRLDFSRLRVRSPSDTFFA